MKFKDRFKKVRLIFIYPIGLLAVIFFSSTDISLLIGIPFIIAGCILRAWANGYAIKMDKLTTSGPYAFMRHPLYLGTILILIGFVVILNTSYLGLLFISLAIYIYARTILREEKMLKEKFGNEYLDYKQSVPSVFPKIIPYRKYEQWKFSFSRLIRSKEHKAIVWIIILIIIIHLKEEFVIEHKSVDEKTLYLIIISIVFWLADTIEGYIRSQRKEA